MATANRAARLDLLEAPPGSLELLEDLIGASSPHKGLRIAIPRAHERLDRPDQVRHIGKAAAAPCR